VFVYEIQSQPDDYAALLFDDENDRDVVFDAFDGTSMLAWWRPLRLHWETEGGRYPIPDFTTVGQGPIFSRGAIDAVGELLDGRGERLPIEVADGGEYAFFNVTEFRVALDEDASDLVRFDDGDVMEIDRYQFNGDQLEGATIFMLPQQPNRTYVTDHFAKRAREAGLTGMDLIERWRDASPQA
jgi:uncharacterized protein DUF1629